MRESLGVVLASGSPRLGAGPTESRRFVREVNSRIGCPGQAGAGTCDQFHAHVRRFGAATDR